MVCLENICVDTLHKEDDDDNDNDNNNKKFCLPINSLLLTITSYSSVVTILAFNDTKYTFAALQPSLTVLK